MNQSDNIAELASALSKAQSEIQGAKKDCANPFFKSKYADLSSVWDACRDPLTRNGLSVIQTTGERDGNQYLYTMLAHSSGQWIRSELKVIVGKPDIQALGSSLTYCRRYSLAMIAGVCPEDDDGNDAAQQAKPLLAVTPKDDKINSTQLNDLLTMLRKCPIGFTDWLLDLIFKDNKTEKLVNNIPSSYFDFCKKTIETQIQKQEANKNE